MSIPYPSAIPNGVSGGDLPGSNVKPGPIDITITAGAASVGGDIANGADFVYGSPVKLQAQGSLWVNSVKKSDVDIDTSTYDLSLPSGSTVTVSASDEVQLCIEAPKQLPASETVWGVTRSMWRSVFTTDGSNGTTTFSPPASLPQWDMTIGWGAAGGGTGKLRVEVKYNSSGGVTQKARITTSLQDATPSQESSSLVDPTSTSTQVHTADFNKADAGTGGVMIVVEQPWGDAQSFLFALLVMDGSLIPPLSSGGTLSQTDKGGYVEVG